MIHFKSECLVCEPLYSYKNGFIIGRKLLITKDSNSIVSVNRAITDTLKKIPTFTIKSKSKINKNLIDGSVELSFSKILCLDSWLINVVLQYKVGTISINDIPNAVFFEYDLDGDGTNEQYIFGAVICSQELILLQIK